MATIVNNPGTERESGSGIVTAIIVIIALILLFVFGIPALRGTQAPASGGSTINVPESVDVNVGGGAQ